MPIVVGGKHVVQLENFKFLKHYNEILAELQFPGEWHLSQTKRNVSIRSLKLYERSAKIKYYDLFIGHKTRISLVQLFPFVVLCHTLLGNISPLSDFA